MMTNKHFSCANQLLVTANPRLSFMVSTILHDPVWQKVGVLYYEGT